jgi:hypothetical protein
MLLCFVMRVVASFGRWPGADFIDVPRHRGRAIATDAVRRI